MAEYGRDGGCIRHPFFVGVLTRAHSLLLKESVGDDKGAADDLRFMPIGVIRRG